MPQVLRDKVHRDESPRVREVEWAIIHPPPTVGLIIQTVGNQRVAASIWQTDYGDGQAGLVAPAYASTLYTAR